MQGLLLRNYTQNIDGLERVAGIPGSKLVEAHGTFSSAHCVKCGAAYPDHYVHNKIVQDQIPRCVASAPRVEATNPRWLRYHPHEATDDPTKLPISNTVCDGYVKPDIVFFKESMPRRFFELISEDFDKCDLLLVMGTSLKVEPFAGSISERFTYERLSNLSLCCLAL